MIFGKNTIPEFPEELLDFLDNKSDYFELVNKMNTKGEIDVNEFMLFFLSIKSSILDKYLYNIKTKIVSMGELNSVSHLPTELSIFLDNIKSYSGFLNIFIEYINTNGIKIIK